MEVDMSTSTRGSLGDSCTSPVRDNDDCVLLPLFQAYSQAIKAATRRTSTASGTIHSRSQRYHDNSIVKARFSRVVRCMPGDHPRKRSSRTAQTSSSSSPQYLPTKTFVLSQTGLLQQYGAKGSVSRLPERVLQLSSASAAFACDLIAGEPFVLQILETVHGRKQPLNERSSLLAKLGWRRSSPRRVASSMLLVLKDAQDLENWMRAVRGRINSFAIDDDDTISIEQKPLRPQPRRAKSAGFVVERPASEPMLVSRAHQMPVQAVKTVRPRPRSRELMPVAQATPWQPSESTLEAFADPSRLTRIPSTRSYSRMRDSVTSSAKSTMTRIDEPVDAWDPETWLINTFPSDDVNNTDTSSQWPLVDRDSASLPVDSLYSQSTPPLDLEPSKPLSPQVLRIRVEENQQNNPPKTPFYRARSVPVFAYQFKASQHGRTTPPNEPSCSTHSTITNSMSVTLLAQREDESNDVLDALLSHCARKELGRTSSRRSLPTHSQRLSVSSLGPPAPPPTLPLPEIPRLSRSSASAPNLATVSYARSPYEH